MSSALLRRLRETLRTSLAQNAMALYGAHIAGLVLPLVTIPYLARVLRPDSWGMVIFAQSFAAWLTLVLEYGFYYSATRRIARVREDREEVARIVAAVQGAKGLLLGCISVLALIAYLMLPAFQRRPEILFWAWAIALVQGFSPLWFFQGIERVRAPAIAEAAAKAVTTAAIFLLVRGPGDADLALALQAVPGLIGVFIVTSWIYREVPFRRASLGASAAMLREAVGLFVFRTASGAYIQANAFILGLIAAPPLVAYFGGAERLIRGAINLLHPATQALYPRVSHLVGHDRGQAGRLLGLSLLLVGSLGIVMGLFTFFAAPLLVRVLLGPGYEVAVPVLRVLAALPPIVALETVLGIHWALPTGLDRPVCALVIVGGVLNAALALLLVPPQGAVGMAAAVVCAESIVLLGLVVLAWMHGREVWGIGLRAISPVRRRRATPSTQKA